MKFIVLILIVLIAGLQYLAWFGDDGYFAVKALGERLEEHRRQSERQRRRNRLLAAEVVALKNGHAAVEARARVDLGMIREGETFYILTDEAKQPSPQP